MWKYVKKLEYPINIQNKDLNMAKLLYAQYGGPSGEIGAAMQYLNQRVSMPDHHGVTLLTDIGTEELAHVEMIGTMIMQLIKDASVDEIKKYGLENMFILHDHALFPEDPNGEPFTAVYTKTTGDWRSDLESDMAAEQRARTTYENLMKMTNDPDILGPLSFLRQREVVHYARFKELRDYYLDKYKK